MWNLHVNMFASAHRYDDYSTLPRIHSPSNRPQVHIYGNFTHIKLAHHNSQRSATEIRLRETKHNNFTATSPTKRINKIEHKKINKNIKNNNTH